jgi:hypothetical protein
MQAWNFRAQDRYFLFAGLEFSIAGTEFRVAGVEFPIAGLEARGAPLLSISTGP